MTKNLIADYKYQVINKFVIKKIKLKFICLSYNR